MEVIRRVFTFLTYVIFDLYSPSLLYLGYPRKQHKWIILTGKRPESPVAKAFREGLEKGLIRENK